MSNQQPPNSVIITTATEKDMKKTVSSFIRAYNRYSILTCIRIAELISRIDISKSTGLSQAAVTGITADLISEGLIEEKKPGAYEGGRPPILLSIAPDGAYTIGINMTIEKIDVAVTNFQAQIKAHKTILLDKTHYPPEEIVDIMVRAMQDCMWDANFSKDQISGVGIGIPGLVDSGSGTIRFLPNYGWENVNLRNLFQQRVNIPTFIDNSSNNLTIAENWFGECKGVENFIVVTLQNGVGAGCFINGRLSRGYTGIAGEFGHLTADDKGPMCRCGKKGCIEAFAGINALLKHAAMAARNGIWDHPADQRVTLEDLMTALDNNEPEILKLYEKAGNALGLGIAHLVTLLNPEKIIITGKGVMAKDAIFEPMFRSVNQHISSKFKDYGTQIIIKKWSEKDWVRGAGTLVLNEIYKSPTIN
jgi:predicted NBD/HSP70 family sugar kinase